MLVICLVALVICTGAAHASICTVTAPWYKEHFLKDVSLADLTTLCTLRTTVFALFRPQDAYLLSKLLSPTDLPSI